MWTRLARESFLSGLIEIWSHKLRSILTLAGITIGVFLIVSILCFVDTFQNKIKNDVNQLGENVIYVHKWPWQFSSNYPWWEYFKWPNPSYEEYKYLKENLQLAEAVTSYIQQNDKTAYYGNTSISNLQFKGVIDDYDKIYNVEIGDGRYFSSIELHKDNQISVIGYNIAQELFPLETPLNKWIRIGDIKYQVIGVCQEKGEDMLNISTDNAILVPLNNLKKTVNMRNRFMDITIAVKGYEGIPTTEIKDEIRGFMRSKRKIRPTEHDNFALNQASMLTDQLQGTFVILELIGWLISGLSIFVGGFGVANIMFVTVRERTNIIGIKKALGARRSTILMEFLMESNVISLVGGLIGLILLFAGKYILLSLSEFDIDISLGRVVLGLFISILTGTIAGLIPAYKASRMDPVTAIRFN